ncbi:MAG: hypothetical protein AAFU59_11985 [Pseudomonadota bacterium]
MSWKLVPEAWENVSPAALSKVTLAEPALSAMVTGSEIAQSNGALPDWGPLVGPRLSDHPRVVSSALM